MGAMGKSPHHPGNQAILSFIGLTIHDMLLHCVSPIWASVRRIDTVGCERGRHVHHFDFIGVGDTLRKVMQHWKDIQPLDTHPRARSHQRCRVGEW
uniref:Uncharacterized protein n=1 Tax=Echinococcus canadensis TaxID=519352 RepID=A0A915F0L7_9CEST